MFQTHVGSFGSYFRPFGVGDGEVCSTEGLDEMEPSKA